MNPTNTPPAPNANAQTNMQAAPSAPTAASPQSAQAPQAPQKKKIVVVEDNAALADLYKTRMELAGYTCLVANDGIAGLYLVQSEMPDLVLLDLMVPAIAGDEVLRRMRASDWGKNIKVLIMSNLNEADAPAGLRDLGIVDYLVKMDTTDDMLEQAIAKALQPASQQPAA
jgi:DNA-binding response OmpR family regulator